MAVEIKTTGSSGQISLGKQWAGRTVTVDEVEPGVWVIKTAQENPNGELWLNMGQVRESLDRAIEWSASHPRSESDLNSRKRPV